MYKLVRCTLGVLSLNQFLQSTLDGNKAICHISYVGLPVLFCLLLCPCAHHAQKLDKFEILSPEKPVTNAIPPAPPTLMESVCALLVLQCPIVCHYFYCVRIACGTAPGHIVMFIFV